MEQRAAHPAPVTKKRSKKGYTGHALLRFLDRSTRIPLDNFYFSLLKARYAQGNFVEPTDAEILDHISKGNRLDKFKHVLEVKLRQSRAIHSDGSATYRAIGNRLVAVMNRGDTTAVTILTADQSLRYVPSKALHEHGLLEETPHPTLTAEEIAVTSRCLFKVERRQAARASAERLLRIVQSVEPEMEILSGRGTLCLVVVVHSRQSLERLSEFGGLTLTPYFPSEGERRMMINAERERFPDEDWDEIERKSGYAMTFRPPRQLSGFKRLRGLAKAAAQSASETLRRWSSYLR